MPVFISPDAETHCIGDHKGSDIGDQRFVGPQVVLYVFCRALDTDSALLRGLPALRRTDPFGNALRRKGRSESENFGVPLDMSIF